MSLGIQSQTTSTLDDTFSNDLGTFTAVSWKPADDMPIEKWGDAIDAFERGRKSLNWYIGDGLNWGERKYGEMYAQPMKALGLAYSTLANYKWVARRVEPSVRREGLEWEHHKLVAPRTKEEQIMWLDIAEEGGWSSYELNRAMKGETVTLIGNIEPMHRTKRKLLTEFYSLSYADKSIIDKWLGELSREEINRLTDGEIAESLVRLKAILDILYTY